MSFKDILGQDRAILFLKNSIAGKRIAHAYLFSGPSGVGKKLTALNFAKALNCLEGSNEKPCGPSILRHCSGSNPELLSKGSMNSGPHPEPVDGCGCCISCRKIDAANHPDVFLLRPEKEGGAIKIDAIRGLIISAGLKPYEARCKVYIIDEADSMGYVAQNAFLKTLEEPPPRSVLILITANPGKLFSTVVSRTQMVRFFPLKTGDVRAILTEAHKMDNAAAEALSGLSSGRIGEALRYGRGDFSAKRSRIIKGIIDGAFFVSDFEDIPKEDLGLCLDIMLTWYRDLLVAKIKGSVLRQNAQDDPGQSREAEDGTVFFNADKKDALFIEAGKTDFEKLDNAVRQIILTASYLKQNANPKLAMSALGANIA
ncbi:MAG: DNA polymerase III subunit delta' [Candidatus Omnitrophota bacterium]|nr:DNA polymerase III subunit delta' [Candidatus Omnitrophota bacterium]